MVIIHILLLAILRLGQKYLNNDVLIEMKLMELYLIMD